MIFGLSKRSFVLIVLFGLLLLADKLITVVRDRWPPASDSMEIQKINMQSIHSAPPHFVYVPYALLNRSIYPSGYGDDRLHLYVTYPDFGPVNEGPAQVSGHKLRFSIGYTGGVNNLRQAYLKNYDRVISGADIKLGHLYGYIFGRGEQLSISGLPSFRYPGGDKWIYIDKATESFGYMSCLGVGDPEKYINCTTSLLLDGKYSFLFSVSGEMQRDFETVVANLRKFIQRLKAQP